MADYPCKELNGRTPLEVANHPNMDEIARRGSVGLLETIPEGMYPGTDIAHLSILGYDPKKYYPGRAALEAADLNIKLPKDSLIFRCNLVYVDHNKLIDYSAGHISDQEAKELINHLVKALSDVPIEIYHCSSYRSILILKGKLNLEIQCYPPHDYVGSNIEDIMPKPKVKDAEDVVKCIRSIMLRSLNVLRSHPINKRRISRGLKPANMVWLWGVGSIRKLPSFYKVHGIKGAIISATNLIRGIGRLIGMSIIDVPGITGYYDTNYAGKAEYAIKALANHDLVLVHVEAPDEAGHEGNIEEKIRAIENIDKEIIGRILNNTENVGVVVLTDHYTPVSLRRHVAHPVPYAIYGMDGVKADRFTEKDIKKVSSKILKATNLINTIISRKPL
mgnify:CR=1 FL=1